MLVAYTFFIIASTLAVRYMIVSTIELIKEGLDKHRGNELDDLSK